MLGAFVGYRSRIEDVRDRGSGIGDQGSEAKELIPDPQPLIPYARKLEIALVLAIFALAAFLRFYRLGDWTTGMHGDEGEAGIDSLNILKGSFAPLFGSGWFQQPNFYYWGVALGMKLFGTDLFGLRIFAAVSGVAIFLPFYPLVKMWFGVRTAIIATFLLAISDVSIHFSKMEFSNITTPLSLVLGLYFLFSGLRTNRTWQLVLAGYGFMFGLYFYNGGRLNPIFLAAILAYMFVLTPAVRLPGVYRCLRNLSPGLDRALAFRQAVWQQMRGVYGHSGQIVALVIACVCFASPWAAYYLDNKDMMGSRAYDKMIFTNTDNWSITRYGATHDPLYIGLRLPKSSDIYPILPVAFERTPFSLKVAGDGYWPRVLWNQLTTTLSILTLRGDTSSVYTFTDEPIAKPLEAALIVLGIALALWRWRDTRMAVLSIWFWSIIFAGGVLTTEAPYMARLVGIIPALAIFAAIVLNRLASEFTKVANRVKAKGVIRIPSPYFLTLLLISTILAYLAWQNIGDYYGRYLAKWPFSRAVGQAAFVREMDNKLISAGRSTPMYYSLGMNLGIDVIYWPHGVNRFLNQGVPGFDLLNPSDELPVTNDGGRDLIFMVYDKNIHYLPIIEAYYPGGEEGTYSWGAKVPSDYSIIYYHVPREQVEAHRHVTARYVPSNGPPIQRQESNFGSYSLTQLPTPYSVQATWTGQLVAPAFAHYRFRLAGSVEGKLVIDGISVVTSTNSTARSEGDVILAAGLHNVELSATLPDNKHSPSLAWSTASDTKFYPIGSQYLWLGPGRGLVGEVRPSDGADPASLIPVTQRRVDGFLGFGTATDVFGGDPFMATWKGNLNVKQDGEYEFETNSNGGSELLIDDKVALGNEGGTFVSGKVDLKAGVHSFELRYNWNADDGYLEVYWTPPGGKQMLIGPDVFTPTEGGAWPPDSVTEPPAYQLPKVVQTMDDRR